MNQMDQGVGESKIGLKEVQDFLEKYEVRNVKNAFLDKIATLLFIALGLVAALAWEETFKEIFAYFFDDLNSIGQKALYAILITFIAVIVSVLFGKYIINKQRGN